MNLELQGKVALVLGAGGGLGRAIAIALAAEGATLALADIHDESLAQTEQEVKKRGAGALPLVWDLADLGKVDANVASIEQRFGAVDVLINITGGPPPTPAAGQDPQLWEKSFAAMILPVIAITDRVLPEMSRHSPASRRQPRRRLSRRKRAVRR